MAFHRTAKAKQKLRFPILLLAIAITAIAVLLLFSFLISTNGSSSYLSKASENVVKFRNGKHHKSGHEKYLYWGDRIDCPGKHCGSCEGLGHQESSLRCALEEAMYLQRTFVMPSRMCISPIHNKKGILHHSSNVSSEERWTANSCAMDSLYDIDLISDTVPVILDNSKEWHKVLSTSMKLGARGFAHVEGVNRVDLKENSRYSNILLINRTASPLSWFMECKDRNNRTNIMLPYSFLPSMAAKRLREVAAKIKAHLGDYVAIHVRRGDKIKTRKDRFGVHRSLHPHLDRDTRPEFILHRIEKWVAPGRTLFIASNERTPGFFSPLSARYKMVYSSNFSEILDPVVENNYQLFMIERLILMGAKTFIRTFKEDDTDLSLTDDPKKNTKVWQIPVYTADEKR
ncbi:Calcium ion binding [Quillaja saponaria]|uniref:Calcium ion binding n=1 Tax=Quillaja saponaria TaxID=32244 RepID=A0AAD7Q863_QUISA|nr:Calcium ion binding [Quillaja saponaria]